MKKQLIVLSILVSSPIWYSCNKTQEVEETPVTVTQNETKVEVKTQPVPEQIGHAISRFLFTCENTPISDWGLIYQTIKNPDLSSARKQSVLFGNPHGVEFYHANYKVVELITEHKDFFKLKANKEKVLQVLAKDADFLELGSAFTDAQNHVDVLTYWSQYLDALLNGIKEFQTHAYNEFAFVELNFACSSTTWAEYLKGLGDEAPVTRQKFPMLTEFYKGK